ncbi:unnamed protein product, partial [Clonostachys rhizophaga]
SGIGVLLYSPQVPRPKALRPPVSDIPDSAPDVPSAASPSPLGYSKMAPKGFERFLSSLNDDYFNTDTFSDVVIVCEDQEFKVHKLVLACHSKYFEKQLNGNWKESLEKKIEIQDFDSGIVESMLRYMYSFNYNNIRGVSSMVYDAQVYQIADKYDIPTLKEYSKDRFNTAITTGWNMDEFPLAINVVYESTPSEDRGLRDLVVETSLLHLDSLLEQDGFGNILRTSADFSADLIPFLAPKTSIKECNSCSQKIRRGGQLGVRQLYNFN